MALRVTQTYVSALGDEPAGFDGTGLLRVTQVYISALGDEPAGFDGLGLLRATQIHATIVAGEPAGFDGTGLLRATQLHCTIVAGEPAGFDGLGVMRVTQMHLSVLAGIPAERVEDTIALSESVETLMSYLRSVSDTIALTETASRTIAEDDSIGLTESIILHYTKHVSDTIALTEDTTTRMSYLRDLSDAILLNDSCIRVVTPSDTITLDDAIVQVATVEDTISLEEIIFNDKIVSVTDTISLSDEADQPTEASDLIELTEEVQAIRAGLRDADDEIALYETISFIHTVICGGCCDITERYAPQVGISSDPDVPPAPSATVPTLTPSHSIVLSHPFSSPTLTVTLRAPEFDNKDAIENKRINRESRGGTLLIYADLQWPKIYRLEMEFSALKESVAQEYMAFRAATLGQEIRLVDYESRVWRGVLLDVDQPITRNRRHGITATLSFEGELA